MKSKIVVTFCAVIVMTLSCREKKTSSVVTNKTDEFLVPNLELIWKTDTLLTTCESVLYRPEEDLIYVSNINHGPWEKDGNGFISKISTSGEIINLKWIEGISAPKGMGVLNGKLYVNDIDRVVEIDLQNQEITKEFIVENNPQLNDITVGNGKVYSSGSNSDAIYKIVNNTINEVAKDSLGRLNGLLFQDEGIYYSTSSTHNFGLYEINNKTFKTLVTDIGHGDGIIRLENGDFIISSWKGQLFYINSKNWNKTLLLDTENESIYAADIDYIPETKTLLVPTFFHNRVMAYKLNYTK